MSAEDEFAAWIGNPRSTRFRIDPWPAAALAAALDRDHSPAPGTPLPPFWHHLYGLPVVHASRTGPDGHPLRGDFLPPVPLPRRMWAGGRLQFERPLIVGQEVERRSVVKDVVSKAGRHGPLVFVLVEHRLSGPDGLAMIEEHDIVYRAAPRPGEPSRASPAPDGSASWERAWQPDEVLLFRYSALTYNGHRIHYDLNYAKHVEGYPAVIVHGPLLATLMLDLVHRHAPTADIRRFAFRALSPVFAGERLLVCGEPDGKGAVALRVEAPVGVAMRGEATLA